MLTIISPKLLILKNTFTLNPTRMMSYSDGKLQKKKSLPFQKKKEREKSSALLLLLVKHFEITLSNCTGRLSAAMSTNCGQSCCLALAIHVGRPSLASLLSTQPSCNRPSAAMQPSSATAKPIHQQLRGPTPSSCVAQLSAATIPSLRQILGRLTFPYSYNCSSVATLTAR